MGTAYSSSAAGSGEPEMVFNAGTHTDAIRMHYGDFAELARPTVGQFCRCRTAKPID